MKKTKSFNRLFSVLAVAILCFAGLNGCHASKSDANVPSEPVDSTNGYVYFFDEAKKALIQHESATGIEQPIWELKGYPEKFSYLVTESKLYIIDDNGLYSINADGSEEFKYDGSFVSSGLPSMPSIVIVDDWIYACTGEQGQFGANTELVRIALDGSSTQKIDMEFPSAFLFTDGQMIYVISDYEAAAIDIDSLSVSITEIDHPTSLLCANESTAYTVDGKSVSAFGESELHLKDVFDTTMGTPLGGHNHYLFFKQDTSTDSKFIVLDLSTGESETFDKTVDQICFSGDSCVLLSGGEYGPEYAGVFDTETGELQ